MERKLYSLSLSHGNIFCWVYAVPSHQRIIKCPVFIRSVAVVAGRGGSWRRARSSLLTLRQPPSARVHLSVHIRFHYFVGCSGPEHSAKDSRPAAMSGAAGVWAAQRASPLEGPPDLRMQSETNAVLVCRGAPYSHRQGINSTFSSGVSSAHTIEKFLPRHTAVD